MTDMIERVARAIFPHCVPIDGVGCCNDPDFDQCHWCVIQVKNTARAAIASMREPTEEMAQTVASAYTAGVANPQMITKIYSAVIDAALGGK